MVGTADVCSQAEVEDEPPAGCIGHTYLIILRVRGMQLMLNVQLLIPYRAARQSVCSEVTLREPQSRVIVVALPTLSTTPPQVMDLTAGPRQCLPSAGPAAAIFPPHACR